MQHIVITGASTGIGYTTAKYLLQHGYRVWGSVRNAADAERLARELGKGFEPLLFDVTDTAGITAAAAKVAAATSGQGIAGLVNNAGIAVSGPLQYLDMAQFRQQMEVNVFGLLQVTQAFLPLLGAVPGYPHAPGRIVNISSVSGKITTPFMGPYSASKFAVEALTHALRRELHPFGIDAVSVQPGPVKTPIWEKAIAKKGAYMDTPYAPTLAATERHVRKVEADAVPPQAVAKAVLHALTARRPRTQYVVHRNRLAIWLAARLPDRVLDGMMISNFKKLAAKER